MTKQPDQPDPTSSQPQESVPSQHLPKPAESDEAPKDSASQDKQSMLDDSESGDDFFANEVKSPVSDPLDDLFSQDPYESETKNSGSEVSANPLPEEAASSTVGDQDRIHSESVSAGSVIGETLDAQSATGENIPPVISSVSQVTKALSDSPEEPKPASASIRNQQLRWQSRRRPLLQHPHLSRQKFLHLQMPVSPRRPHFQNPRTIHRPNQ